MNLQIRRLPTLAQIIFYVAFFTFSAELAFAQIELVINGGFESGSTGWTLSGNFYADSRFTKFHNGSGYAYVSNPEGTSGNNLVGSMYQSVTIPTNVVSATLTFWYNITSQEIGATSSDILNVTIQDSNGNFLATVSIFSNLDKDPNSGNPYYHQKTFDMTPYKGRTVRLNFLATTNSTLPTTFRIDDVSLTYIASQPDLIPQNLTVNPTSVNPGASVTVNFTVKNQGNGTANSSKTNIRLNASSTQVILTDKLLTSVTTPSLSAGASTTHTETVTIPNDTPAGNYYVWVILDVGDLRIGQRDESNDKTNTPLTIVPNKPDLIPQNLTVNPTSVSPGANVIVSFTVKNQGNGAASSSRTNIRLNTSSTQVILTDKLLTSVTTPSLVAGSSTTHNETVTIPSNTSAGNYHIWVTLDVDSSAGQGSANEANDKANTLLTVGVAPPDLIPQNLTVNPTSVNPGASVTVSFTVKNQGSGTASSSKTNIRLNTSPTQVVPTDKLLTSVTTPSLAAGVSTTHSETVTIPSNTSAGSYYVWVTLDVDSSAGQGSANEANDKANTLLIVGVTPPSTPVITGISPNPVTGSNDRQWLTISGSGFVAGLSVTLRTGGNTYPIPNTTDRTNFVSAAEVRVFVNVTTDPADWTAQVINPGNVTSNQFSFRVTNPTIDILLFLPFPNGAIYTCTQKSNTGPSHDLKATKYDLDLSDGNRQKTSPIVAAADGIAYGHRDVDGKWFGNHVNIDHGGGFFTLYGHLDQFDQRLLDADLLQGRGVGVKKGQVIGYEGNSGGIVSTIPKEQGGGIHIHFGLHKGDPKQDARTSESVPMTRLVARDNTAGGAFREMGSVDFVEGHRYESNNSSTLQPGNPSPTEIANQIKIFAQQYKIPSVIIAAVMSVESPGWKQFDDNNKPLIGSTGDIGLMQIKVNEPFVSFDAQRVRTDWMYNLEIGCRILQAKFSKSALDTPSPYDSHLDTEPDIIENWYYPVAWYNGEGIKAYEHVTNVWNYLASPPPPANDFFNGITSIGNPQRIPDFPRTIYPQIPYPKDSLDLKSATPQELISHGMYTLLVLVQKGQRVHRWRWENSSVIDIADTIIDDKAEEKEIEKGIVNDFKNGVRIEDLSELEGLLQKRVIVKKQDNIPPHSEKLKKISKYWEIDGPKNTKFKAKLSFPYIPSDIAGLDVKKIALAYLDGTVWKEVTTWPEPEKRTGSGELWTITPHFSAWTIIEPTPISTTPTTPLSPTNLIADFITDPADGSHHTKLTWSLSESEKTDEISYLIYRSNTEITGSNLNSAIYLETLPKGETTYLAKVEDNMDKTVYYAVIAQNIKGIKDSSFVAGNIVLSKPVSEDTKPPDLKVTTNQTFVKGDQQVFIFISSDEELITTGAKELQVEIIEPGTLIVKQAKVIPNNNKIFEYKTEATGPDGIATIKVIAHDKYFNKTEKEKIASFTIDRTPPIINVKTDPEGVNTQTSVKINVASNEVIKLPKVEVIEPSSTNPKSVNMTSIDKNTFSGTYPVSATVPEGKATITVIAHDEALNETISKSSFIIDRTPPVISIIIPGKAEFGTLLKINVPSNEPLRLTGKDALSVIVTQVGANPVSVEMKAGSSPDTYEGFYEVRASKEGKATITATISR